MPPAPDAAEEDRARSSWAIFLIFLRLGLTSFGGPVAHLGYFHAEFVERRRWLDAPAYADLVALCQFLPGPASSQVEMALGLARAGYPGALAAWCGFTLPSAAALVVFALGLVHFGQGLPAGALHGLKVVAVAVVAQALLGMGRALCADTPRRALAGLAALCVLLFPATLTQLLVIAFAGLAGLALFKPTPPAASAPLTVGIGLRAAVLWLAVFFLLLVALPILAHWGGGHVVLPLLQAEVVAPGWVSRDLFLAGYAAAQAVPGPLFTFAAFLGAAMNGAPNGALGGMLCLLAVFAPSFLLVAGTLPFWVRLRGNAGAQTALAGINAAVVGLLLAAFVNPVWTGAIRQPSDLGLALLAFAALVRWRWPPWLVVLVAAPLGAWLP